MDISEINQEYLHYKSLRSARRWFSENGLPITRLGKKYFVKKTTFETLILGLTGIDLKSKVVSEKTKLNPDEQKILKSLQKEIREI